MTNTVEATEKDFQQMIQMLTSFAVTQIIGAAAAYKIADHLAKGALSAKQIAAAEGISADATFPRVMPSAAAAATALGLADRSKAVSGDFFAYVPEADLYLLKFILHDWNDERCVRILENCRRAMRRGGRVIVVEMLLGEIGEPGPGPIFDLLMMVILSGCERSLNEYRALLERAGLRLEKNSPTSTALSVMEAVAA
jgi:O-methyltransferase domain